MRNGQRRQPRQWMPALALRSKAVGYRSNDVARRIHKTVTSCEAGSVGLAVQENGCIDGEAPLVPLDLGKAIDLGVVGRHDRPGRADRGTLDEIGRASWR